MGLSMIDKLTNYLMPMEKVAQKEQLESVFDDARGRKLSNLHVHTNQAVKLKVLIVSKAKFDDVHTYADYLKANKTVLLNLAGIDQETQNAIKDFMNGVCYTLVGNVQRVADYVFIYTPSNVVIEKELYAYSVPAYVKPKLE